MDGQMEMIVGEEMARNIRSIGNKHGGDGSDKNVTEMGRQQPQQPKHIKMEIKEEVPAEANQSDQWLLGLHSIPGIFPPIIFIACFQWQTIDKHGTGATARKGAENGSGL